MHQAALTIPRCLPNAAAQFVRFKAGAAKLVRTQVPAAKTVASQTAAKLVTIQAAAKLVQCHPITAKLVMHHRKLVNYPTLMYKDPHRLHQIAELQAIDDNKMQHRATVMSTAK